MSKPKVSTTFDIVDKMTSPMRRMQSNVTRIAGAIGGVFITGKIAQGIKSFITEASKIEDAVAGFTPLMGGVEKANKLVDQLNKTAATTPFQFEDISSAAKQLLPVMNGDIEKTIATFRMLGDTAGGNAQKLDSITRGFMKSMLKGKVDMESLNMIAEAGVPIYSELADSMGVSVAEMMKMSSAGKITSDDLTRAFQKMTSQGGVFFNGMEIASQTFSGKMSTLKDNIALTQAAIGKSLMPTLKPLLDRMIEIAGIAREWVEANQDMINQKVQDTLQKVMDIAGKIKRSWDSGLIPALLGGAAAFKAVSFAITGAQGVIAGIKAVQAIMKGGSLISLLLGGPVGIIAVVAAAIAGLVILIVKNWDKIKETVLNVWNKIKAPFEKIQEFFGKIKGTDEDTSAAQSRGMAAAGGVPIPGLVSPNAGMIQNSSSSTSHSYLNVDFANMPQGATVKQKGVAPGINLNYGYSQGRLNSVR